MYEVVIDGTKYDAYHPILNIHSSNVHHFYSFYGYSKVVSHKNNKNIRKYKENFKENIYSIETVIYYIHVHMYTI